MIKILTITHIGIDVMVTETNCTYHYDINADLKATLLAYFVMAMEFSDGGAKANSKPL